MTSLFSFFRCYSRTIARPKAAISCFINQNRRNYADKPKPDATSKQVVVQGTESEERVRVRRARVADVPRVLRFVREHARYAWPGLAGPQSASHLVLCDYVARALAQGHSMLAEQQEARRSWGSVRGLALSTAVCPWDAAMLERWARCVRCSRSRRLMHFTAHCLRAPGLHDKYRVHNILQVTLIVPPEHPKSSEIINVLAKNAIERGKEVGFSLVRFDVSDNIVAKSLEELQLKKEWQLAYEAFPETIKETLNKNTNKLSSETQGDVPKDKSETSVQDAPHYIAVYTSLLQAGKHEKT